MQPVAFALGPPGVTLKMGHLLEAPGRYADHVSAKIDPCRDHAPEDRHLNRPPVRKIKQLFTLAQPSECLQQLLHDHLAARHPLHPHLPAKSWLGYLAAEDAAMT
jgi:hypothetical protein